MPRFVGGLRSFTRSERETRKTQVWPVPSFVYGGEIISRTLAEPSRRTHTSVQHVLTAIVTEGPPPWSTQRRPPGVRRKRTAAPSSDGDLSTAAMTPRALGR